MGSSTSKQVIKNAITNIVNETNTQLVKMISQSTVNVTSHILQTQEAVLKSDATAMNSITLYGVNAWYGNVTIDQQNDIKLTVGSILNIVQNGDIVSSINTQISNDVLAQVNQSINLQQQINAASQINKNTTTEGEANEFINQLASVFNFSSSDDENKIESKIISNINATSYTAIDIENYVNNIISTNITQKTQNACLQSNNALNQIMSEKAINVYYGNVNLTQSNVLNNYFSCFISSQLTSDDLQNLAAGILNQSTTSSGQGTSIADTMTSSLSQLTSTLTKTLLDNIQYIIIAIVICIIIVGVLIVSSPFLFKQFKKTGLYKKMTYNPPTVPTVPTVPTKPMVQNQGSSKLATAIKNYKKMRINVK
jgi:hypothetical protein